MEKRWTSSQVSQRFYALVSASTLELPQECCPKQDQLMQNLCKNTTCRKSQVPKLFTWNIWRSISAMSMELWFVVNKNSYHALYWRPYTANVYCWYIFFGDCASSEKTWLLFILIFISLTVVGGGASDSWLLYPIELLTVWSVDISEVSHQIFISPLSGVLIEEGCRMLWYKIHSRRGAFRCTYLSQCSSNITSSYWISLPLIRPGLLSS